MCWLKVCSIRYHSTSLSNFPSQTASLDWSLRPEAHFIPPQKVKLQNELSDPSVSQGLRKFQSVQKAGKFRSALDNFFGGCEKIPKPKTDASQTHSQGTVPSPVSLGTGICFRLEAHTDRRAWSDASPIGVGLLFGWVASARCPEVSHGFG